jgi:dihydroorotase
LKKVEYQRLPNAFSNPNNYKEINLENLHVSQGWFDSSVSFGEPGYEERETISNGLKTAALSGFTAVALNANSYPVIDCNTDITFVKSKAENHATRLYPIGALTQSSNGKDLAELFDMQNAGAIAFYDYQKPISNPNLLKIALQYAVSFGGLICSFPQEQNIAGLGVVNEEVNSTKLGLKGNPALAEELQVARDLFLLEYTEGKLHIPTISTSKSVELVREAKAKKLDVTCSVALHNIFFTDDFLSDFDTNFKVLPPLRTKKDCEALIEGLKDGTIDMITSDHNPLDIEHKKVEFDYAKYGTIGLESAFGALQTIFTTKKAISLLTNGKERFQITERPIAEGEKADLTLFNPSTNYTFKKEDILSKSKNSAFIGQKLKGKVYGVIANSKILINL